MPHTPPNMGLHLRYRLWIAEMNSDITVIRIFEDFLNVIKYQSEEVKDKVNNFSNLFITLRKDIDDLRHEMHLLKMKLATYLREGQPVSHKTYLADKHIAVKKHYYIFRKIFSRTKSDFKIFEDRCLAIV
jgi:hypothetical protein